MFLFRVTGYFGWSEKTCKLREISFNVHNCNKLCVLHFREFREALLPLPDFPKPPLYWYSARSCLRKIQNVQQFKLKCRLRSGVRRM